jgi:D-alanine-D-alanine ligase
LHALRELQNVHVELIGLTRDGAWYRQSIERAEAGVPLSIVQDESQRIVIVPGSGMAVRGGTELSVDCAIPLVHGTYGEDGTLQGLLDMADIPYVGSDVQGSSVGIDKIRTKRLWAERGLPIVPYLAVHNEATSTIPQSWYLDVGRRVADELGYPVFVKPNRAGSSVGISRVADPDELATALTRAIRIDSSLLIETALPVREIETAVLGNWAPQAFPPGEVIPTHTFYDYNAKYEDPEGARLEIPARLTPEQRTRIESLAVEAFTAIGAAGFARVDCFLVTDGPHRDALFLNEINTIPGFTPISMYPKMVAAGGISYAELLRTLIDLAIERGVRESSRSFVDDV